MTTEELAEGRLAKHCAHADVVDGSCSLCGFTVGPTTEAKTEPKPDDAGEARKDATEQEAPPEKDGQETK
jgi:hypothetical protein